MNLKTLVPPLLILISFAVLIGFIKPDYTGLQEKKDVYATRLSQTENMGKLLSNADALVRELNAQPARERLVREYLPRQIDQERVIDALNFLASRSGVAVVIMKLDTETQTPVPEVESREGETILPGITVGAVEGSPVPLVETPKVQAKAFSAEVTVAGRYDNIKDFFQRLAHMNRMNKVKSFGIVKEKSKENTEEDTETTTDVLIGTFVADFEFFDMLLNQNVLYDSVFAQEAFDLSPFEMISKWTTEEVPPLEKPMTGRPNPFQ